VIYLFKGKPVKEDCDIRESSAQKIVDVMNADFALVAMLNKLTENQDNAIFNITNCLHDKGTTVVKLRYRW
jgi:hypothetical protein